jgi:hypothetical protein
MARGWESKDVESQQELAEERRRLAAQPKPSDAEIERQRAVEKLELDRRRVLNDLERARHPRHREQLQQALAHVDAQLATLNSQ